MSARDDNEYDKAGDKLGKRGKGRKDGEIDMNSAGMEHFIKYEIK